MSSTNVLGHSEIEDTQGNIPRLHEWRFNLSTGQVQEKLLCEIPSEFPRLNEKYLGRFARYGYSAKAGQSQTSV
jgi:carotenoid cleavage dioxygenase